MVLIQDQIKDVIEDSTTTKEQLDFFEKRLRENLIIAESKIMKSLFFFHHFFDCLACDKICTNKEIEYLWYGV